MIHRDLLEHLRIITTARQTLDTARLKENSFTRNRGMRFADAVSFLLDMRKSTLQTRLNLYFGE